MTKEQIELTIHLLEDLDERYGNDGCNDLSEVEEELIKPIKDDILKVIGEEDEKDIYFNGYLTQYIIEILKKELKKK